MDELRKFKLHEAFMESELQALRMRIQYMEIIQAEEKDNSVPCTEPKPSKQTESSPSQTAHGKGTSNPLMAEALPKSLVGETSTKLVTPGDFTKSIPEVKSKEKEIQIPKDEKPKAVTGLRPNTVAIKSDSSSQTDGQSSANIGYSISPKKHYVVFNRPYVGIYDT